MLMTAHIRALMEEEEIKNLLQKDKGKDNEFEHALEQNDELASMDFHKVEMATLLRDLETNEQQGLTTEQAKAKLAKVGPNKLNEKTPLPWYIKLLLEMVGIFSLLLWAGSILCFIAYGLQPSDPSNVSSFATKNISYISAS